MTNRQTDDGISITGVSVNVIIEGNRCFDDQGTKTQDYGIRIGTYDKITIVNNDLRDNKIAALEFAAGTNLTIRDNLGHVTENRGADIILNGWSARAVNHGCSASAKVTFCVSSS